MAPFMIFMIRLICESVESMLDLWLMIEDWSFSFDSIGLKKWKSERELRLWVVEAGY